MAELFGDIIPSIMVNKRDVLLTEDDEKSYVPFIVNRALSKHLDTVLFANEMNKYSGLDKRLQYDFLLNIVRPYRRPFKKWDKYVKPDDLEVVKEFYECSNEKALEILELLTDEQVVQIKGKLNYGGVTQTSQNSKARRRSG